MSTQYPGGFITKSPVAPTISAASGIWTVDQALQYVKAGTWPEPIVFMEDLFSTYLYTGNSSTQTITNNINLSGDGGLVWIKPRSGTYGVDNHILTDTVRGSNKNLYSNLDIAETTTTSRITAFNSNGFSLLSENGVNNSATTYVSWTFKKQPKFFDVVTYTGDGIAGRTVSHNLGSVPGCIIIKRTNTSGSDWIVYHRGLASPAGSFMNLNLTSAVTASTTIWNNTSPTSSVFSLGSNTPVNGSGSTYVAYLFAHNAGGFPPSGSGSSNGITCGTFTTDGSGNTSINLGYEPQFFMHKKTSATSQWYINDNMRGMFAPGTAWKNLYPNLTTAEQAQGIGLTNGLNSTGLTFGTDASSTYIYIAIRRGPMKTPTVGTNVFSPNQVNAAALTPVTTNFPVDLQLAAYTAISNDKYALDRVRGVDTSTANDSGARLMTNLVSVEAYAGSYTNSWGNTGFLNAGLWAGQNSIFWNFCRAPGFFDIVGYTGTGGATTFTHNLGVVPEMMIVKRRTGGNSDWVVYTTTTTVLNYLQLQSTDGVQRGANIWNDVAPTASVFTVGTNSRTNDPGNTLVNYLFATLAGVSKVGTYTGTGATQTISCGFSGGARFVLIKRTDSTGSWWVWDSARGMTSGTDPRLTLNTLSTQLNADYVLTATGGFQIVTTDAEINASGGTYTFLAIA